MFLLYLLIKWVWWFYCARYIYSSFGTRKQATAHKKRELAVYDVHSSKAKVLAISLCNCVKDISCYAPRLDVKVKFTKSLPKQLDEWALLPNSTIKDCSRTCGFARQMANISLSVRSFSQSMEGFLWLFRRSGSEWLLEFFQVGLMT